MTDLPEPPNHDLANPYDSPDIKDPLDDNWAAKRKLAEATRQLIANAVTATNSTAEIEAITATVEQQVQRLAEQPALQGRNAFEQAGGYGGRANLFYELNPIDGLSNPIAPPLHLWIDKDKAHGRVTMGWQYEGPPQSVHGGFVAAVFDQFLGMAQRLTDRPGFTGTLTVKYIKPTPLDTELYLTAWVERMEGRKNFLAGEMYAGDTLTATCEAVFISVTKDQLKAALAERESEQGTGQAPTRGPGSDDKMPY